jgi:nicotinamide-nucleotide amidase
MPGSSAVVKGGIVSYAIPVKHAVLGVSDGILDAPGVGAVSSECAAGHVRGGARRVLLTDVAVSA